MARLRDEQARVRFSGWMMWDSEHKFAGKSRGTMWEIHPAHDIEVRRGSKWVSLEEWLEE